MSRVLRRSCGVFDSASRPSRFASEVTPNSPPSPSATRPWGGERLGGSGRRARCGSQESRVELRAGADLELPIGVAQVHLDRLDRDEGPGDRARRASSPSPAQGPPQRRPNSVPSAALHPPSRRRPTLRPRKKIRDAFGVTSDANQLGPEAESCRACVPVDRNRWTKERPSAPTPG